MARPDRSKEELSEKILADLQEKYPNGFIVVPTVVGPVACRCPSRSDYQRFQSNLFDDKKKAQAVDMLVTASLIYPDIKTFNDMVDQAPGIMTPIGSELIKFAGSDGDAEAKKY